MIWGRVAAGLLTGRGLVIVAVLVAAAAGAGGYQVAAWRYGRAMEAMRADHAEAEAEALRKAEASSRARQAAVERAEALLRSLTEAAAQAEALRQQERKVVERVVTEEVVKYVQSDNARDCGLDAAGVRIHDAAARGRLPEDPEPTGQPDGAAAGAANARVIQVVTENYATCNETRDRLLALQQWARAIHQTEKD